MKAMMTRLLSFLIVGCFLMSTTASFANVDGKRIDPTSIIVTPAAPKFTDAERQVELARRRAAVAAKMVDKSVMVLFSAEHKLYTNDVNYVFRQENNLYS